MNSQETLWFIGKCLSLAVHPERAGAIQEVLESGKINWNSLVYQSSNQLVLPALYLNLKRNHLLEFLPNDLVAHLDDITNQNRERNQAILNQVEEITLLLRATGLEPVYLKGTAHLLDGLYEDIAERMLSDIDLLLDKKEARKAWEILKNNHYVEHYSWDETAFNKLRHLIGLFKNDKVATVEVHRRLLEGKFDKKFNWISLKEMFKKSSSILGALILSNKDMILHNMMNVQMNDNADKMYKLFLRQSYDLMLLAKREDPLGVSKEFGYFFCKFNSYIALSADILDYPEVLKFENSKKIKRHIALLKLIWKFPRISNFIGKCYFVSFRLYRYFSQLFLFFIQAKVRRRVISSLKNPDYYKAHWALYKKWFS